MALSEPSASPGERAAYDQYHHLVTTSRSYGTFLDFDLWLTFGLRDDIEEGLTRLNPSDVAELEILDGWLRAGVQADLDQLAGETELSRREYSLSALSFLHRQATKFGSQAWWYELVRNDKVRKLLADRSSAV